jgi:hypothetical protein
MKCYSIHYISNFDTETIYKILKNLEYNTDKVFKVFRCDITNTLTFKTSTFNYNNYIRFIVELDYGALVNVDIL